MTDPRYIPTSIGLLIALFGPALLFTPLADLLGPRERLATRVRELLVLWVLAAAVLAIVVCGERRPVSSIGLRFELRSIVGGLMLAAVLIYAVAPLLYRLLAALPARGFERGLLACIIAHVVADAVGFLSAHRERRRAQQYP